MGGQPLLTLVSVDWLKVDKAVDNIAMHPKCLVQVPQFYKLIKMLNLIALEALCHAYSLFNIFYYWYFLS